MRAAIIFLALCLPAFADLAAGQRAYKNSDFATALREFLPLAKQGNADAQLNLGVMYHQGQGVPQDYKEAVKWYRLAADQGNAGGQFELGVLYEFGQGVPQDYVLAYMWFNLSGASSKDQTEYASRNARDMVAKKMTPGQIAEAQRLARAWKPKARH